MRLLLTNFHRGDGGGHTTYLLALARMLADRHEVHVAAPGESRLLRQVAGLARVQPHAWEFPNGLAGVLRARTAFARWLAERRFDVVHVNGTPDHRLVAASLPAHHRPGVVWTKHNSKRADSLGHRWRARRTDAVIAVSGHTAAGLARSPYARVGVATVRNGVDVAHFAPWPADRAAEARHRFLGDDVALVLGSNAGTGLHKGWMDLLEAVARLPADARLRVRVLLAGARPADAVLDRVAALGLRDQVAFAGLLDDVRPMIAACDAGFVLSHAIETISFACREMMAMGKPVLVSDYAGLPENVRDGEDGWVVRTRDVDAIAAAILRMLDTRDRLPAMGAAARAHAVADFGLDGFVEATERVYRDALARVRVG